MLFFVNLVDIHLYQRYYCVNQVYIRKITMFSLKNVMRANAASCLLFGILFVLLADSIVIFLGDNDPAPPFVLVGLGLILIVNGAHLLWASHIPIPGKALVLYFSIGDFIWVVLSVGLVVTGIWVTTVPGILLTLFIAFIVGCFGLSQLFFHNKTNTA